MSRAGKPSLGERIDAALSGREMTFADLAEVIYPPARWPRAWRGSSNGGPPGCYMALSAGLRRGGFRVRIRGPGPGQRIVEPRQRVRSARA